MAAFRPFVHIRNYGASRLPTSAITSKSSPASWSKQTSDNILSLVWKSAAYASSVLKPVASVVFRTSYPSEKKVIRDQSSDLNDGKIIENDRNTTYLTSASSSGDGNKTNEFLVDKPAPEKQSGLEEAFFEWLTGVSHVKPNEVVVKERKVDTHRKPAISKSSLEQRSRFLVRSLGCATSPASKLVRLEEISSHLLSYPDEKSVMVKDGLLRTLLWMKQSAVDPDILAQLRMALSLVGYHDPPKGNGIRILSIDGGGTRGLMVVEILKLLEEKTNKRVYELFDYICGVSSGAILSFLLGGLRLSLDECEMLYKQLSTEIFSQSPIWGTGRLMWNHAYYDTTIWVNVLKNVFQEKLVIDTAKEGNTPRLAAVSAIMNLPCLQAFVFRNYDFPSDVQSQYLGSCNFKLWEAVRASGAAPGYFEELCLGDYLHQDGGVMMNNPTALAIHESRLLWPSEYIQCVVSIGSGRYSPAVKSTSFTSTNLKTKILKIIDSATDTEGVHIAMNDLLSSHTYFRFNPYLTEFLSLDENRPEKLQQLKTDAQMYLRRNEFKLGQAADVLSQKRTVVNRVKDWLHFQKTLFL